MKKNITDKQIIEKIKKGEKKAYDLLVIKYQQRVINLILRFVKNHSDAQDVAQEVFIKAYRALPRFRGDSAFYTWIYRIAINTAKNHLTKEARKFSKYHQDINEMEQIEDNNALTEHVTPESLLIKDELQNVILKSVNSLPTDLQSVILLREVEGLSYEEIADVMKCPVGTVRSRIFRARVAIDKKIKPLLDN